MEESILKISEFGNKFWVKPERYNDTIGYEWTKENEINICTYDGHILHKTDGPAIEWSNGAKHWFQNGKRHREDGPAIEWSYGTKCWYINGKLHRENGPAIEYWDGDKVWYWHGKDFDTKQQWLVHKLKSIRDGRINS